MSKRLHLETSESTIALPLLTTTSTTPGKPYPFKIPSSSYGPPQAYLQTKTERINTINNLLTNLQSLENDFLVQQHQGKSLYVKSMNNSSRSEKLRRDTSAVLKKEKWVRKDSVPNEYTEAEKLKKVLEIEKPFFKKLDSIVKAGNKGFALKSQLFQSMSERRITPLDTPVDKNASPFKVKEKTKCLLCSGALGLDHESHFKKESFNPVLDRVSATVQHYYTKKVNYFDSQRRKLEDDIQELQAKENEKTEFAEELIKIVKTGTIRQLRIKFQDGVGLFRKNINSRDKTGMTMLHWAVIRNRPDMAMMLLQQKASVEIPDLMGRTARTLFAKSHMSRMLEAFEWEEKQRKEREEEEEKKRQQALEEAKLQMKSQETYQQSDEDESP